MKIFHIAPFNTAGVPLEFVKAERALGHESRLVTLGRSKRGYEEDICLDLPFLDFWGTKFAKKLVSTKSKLEIDNIAKIPKELPIRWRPSNVIEGILLAVREKIWKKKIGQFINQYTFFNFDIYQLDGGLGFYRDGEIITKLKKQGKKIICCYTGSDLRTRGVIPEIDRISDLNITVEFDHLRLHPKIQHVFFPINPRRFALKMRACSARDDSQELRIGHAPTNRKAKGSNIIISAIKELEKEYAVKLILIENLPHERALQLKSTCHIFIDQIGDLGYGINALESLSMGIATCSSLAEGFAEKYPDHPFVVVDEQNLRERIIELIKNPQLRQVKGMQGRRWVEEYHDAKKVVKEIHRLAGIG